ncbi:MAG: hypothetical protein ACKPKO_16360, partial [Candidatus Fonsibacter sp.]
LHRRAECQAECRLKKLTTKRPPNNNNMVVEKASEAPAQAPARTAALEESHVLPRATKKSVRLNKNKKWGAQGKHQLSESHGGGQHRRPLGTLWTQLALGGKCCNNGYNYNDKR